MQQPIYACTECQTPCALSIPFIEALPEHKKNRVLAAARHYTLQKGEELFAWMEPAHALYIIKAGQVKLCRWDKEGREQIIGIFADGDIIWEGLFMDGSVFPYSGIALTAVQACSIPIAALQNALEDTAAAMQVIGMLSRKLHDANKRSLILSTQSPKARLARFLTYRFTRSDSPVLTLKLQDIAGSVALRPETVSRKLGELMNEGILQKEGQSSLRIVDAARLRQVYLSE